MSNNVIISSRNLSVPPVMLHQPNCSDPCVLSRADSWGEVGGSSTDTFKNSTFTTSDNESYFNQTKNFSFQSLNSRDTYPESNGSGRWNLFLGDSNMSLGKKQNVSEGSDTTLRGSVPSCVSLSGFSDSSCSPCDTNATNKSASNKNIKEDNIYRSRFRQLKNGNMIHDKGNARRVSLKAKGDLKNNQKRGNSGSRKYSQESIDSANIEEIYKRNLREEVSTNIKPQNQCIDACSVFRIIASHPKIIDPCSSTIAGIKEPSQNNLQARSQIRSGDDNIPTNDISGYNNTRLNVRDSPKRNYLHSYKSNDSFIYRPSNLQKNERYEEESSTSINTDKFDHRFRERDGRKSNASTVIKNTTKQQVHSAVPGKHKDLNVPIDRDVINIDSSPTGGDKKRIARCKNVEDVGDIIISNFRVSKEIHSSMECITYKRIHSREEGENPIKHLVYDDIVNSVRSSERNSSEERTKYFKCGNYGDSGHHSEKRNSTHCDTNIETKSRVANAMSYRKNISACKSTHSSRDSTMLNTYRYSEQNFKIQSSNRSEKSSKTITVNSSLDGHIRNRGRHSSKDSSRSVTVRHARIFMNASVKNYESRNIGDCKKQSRIKKENYPDVGIVEEKMNDNKEIIYPLNTRKISGDSIFSRESEAYSKYRTCSENSPDSATNKNTKPYSRHTEGRKKVTCNSKESGDKSNHETPRSKIGSVHEKISIPKPHVHPEKSSISPRCIGKSVIEENLDDDKINEIKANSSKASIHSKNFRHVTEVQTEKKSTNGVNSSARLRNMDVSKIKRSSLHGLKESSKTSLKENTGANKTDEVIFTALSVSNSLIDTVIKGHQINTNNPTVTTSMLQKVILNENLSSKDNIMQTTSIKKTKSSFRYPKYKYEHNSEKNEKSSRRTDNKMQGRGYFSNDSFSEQNEESDDTFYSPKSNDIPNKSGFQSELASISSATINILGIGENSTIYLNTNTPDNSVSRQKRHHKSTRKHLGSRKKNIDITKPNQNEVSTKTSHPSVHTDSISTIRLSSVSKVADFTQKELHGGDRKYCTSRSSQSSDETMFTSNTSLTISNIDPKPKQHNVLPTKIISRVKKYRSQSKRHVTYTPSLVQKRSRGSSRRREKVYSGVIRRDVSHSAHRHSKRNKSRKQIHRSRGHPRISSYRGTSSRCRQYSVLKSRHVSRSPEKNSYGLRKTSKHDRPTCTKQKDQQNSAWSFKNTVQSWAKKVIESSTWLKPSDQETNNKDILMRTGKNAYVYNSQSESRKCNYGCSARRERNNCQTKESFESVEGKWSNQSGGDYKMHASQRQYKLRVKRGAKVRGAKELNVNSESERQTEEDEVEQQRHAFLPREVRYSQTKKRGSTVINAWNGNTRVRKESSLKENCSPQDVISTDNDTVHISDGVGIASHAGGGIKEMKWAMTQINIFNDGSKTYAIGQQSKKSPPKDSVKNVTRVFVTVPLENGLTKDSTYQSSADG